MEEYNIEVIRQRYQLVPRTLIFIKKDEKYLMLTKRKKNSFGFGKINGVGGHIEKGEEPYEAARREIEEEAGIKVKELDLAAVLFIDINDVPGIQVFVFKAVHDNGKVRDSEEGSLEWMSRAQILSNDKIVKDLPFLLEVVEQHEHQSPPRMVKYIYDDNGELRIV